MTRGEAALGLSASLAAHVALGAALALAGSGRGSAVARALRPEAITFTRLVPRGAPAAAGLEPARPMRRAERRPRAAAPGARLEPRVSAPAPSSAGEPAPEVPGPGVSAEGAGGVEVRGEAGPAGGAEAGDPRALAELARRLEEAARGCYPASARRLRLRGEVGVVFCVGEGGGASALRVERSSGSALLDGAAAACVVPRALPSPGASGCFSLPVRFGLSQ